MKTVRIPLTTSPEQAEKLRKLQAAFATTCNALAPIVQKTKVWNRVALHHMAYKALREQFPEMGSQMVCNAIYSVSRHSRLLFQSPKSPFNVAKLGDRPLPLVHFTESSPVYFDRHTLSVKDGHLSMYTLDGRLRFFVGLKHEDEVNFHSMKLRELVLTRNASGDFELVFMFTNPDDEEPERAPPPDQMHIPEYMKVNESHETR